jgi:hypothetical protein
MPGGGSDIKTVPHHKTTIIVIIKTADNTLGVSAAYNKKKMAAV